MERFQAIVVGAGPAGLVSANLLGQAGIRTLLIERNEGLSGIPKALMVDDEFFRLLHKIGLGDALRAHGVGPVSFDYVSLLGFRVVHNAGRITQNGFPNRTATFQPHFEKILMEGVRRFASVSVRFGTELVDFKQDADQVTLRLSTAEKQETTVAADYLLGADGSHSVCRKVLGIPFDELVPLGQRHVVVDVTGDVDRSLTAQIRMGLRRVYTSLPSPNGGRRYEFSLRRDEQVEQMLSDETLSKLFSRFVPYEQLNIIRKTVYTFHSRLANRLRAGRVFLLGDAAHVMPIFGSQGMNSGARDAHNLMWKLTRVLAGQSDARLLDSYHDERHSQVAETIRVATTNAKLQSSTFLPIAVLRDITIRLMTVIPSVRRYFAEMRYIPKPFLRTGIVLHEEGRTRASMVGRLLPVPLVRTKQGTRLFDEVIGPGWALVGVDLPPAAARLPDDPLWSELGASLVTVAQRPGAADAVTEDNRFEEVFASHAGEWLVVRPDRIVAAAAPPGDVRKLARTLTSLLAPVQNSTDSSEPRKVMTMSEPLNAEQQEGLDNLLVNCAGITKGTRVLLVNEPDTITVDRAIVEHIERSARELGADVRSIWVGPVQGPESVPGEILTAIENSDVSIFNHSMGGMLRLRPMPGKGMGILNYATTPELLGSPWARAPYGLWRKVAKAVAGELNRSRSWHITCARGTDLTGTVPEHERQPSATPSGFMLHTFPIGTHQPTSAETADGTLAIQWLVSSANHDVGDGLRLNAPIVAKVSTGRIVGFTGNSDDIATATRYLEEIGTRYGKDPYLINSWHGGTNPLAFTPTKDVTHLNWWQLLVHNNPRTLHFHAIGEDMPGELSLPVLDPTVEIDGEVVWDRGRFTVLDRPSVQEVVKAWPATPDVFRLNTAIGL